jgi:hypothetical protein
MNKLNDIFKMISQMEKNAEEVKLGKHEVELGSLDMIMSMHDNGIDIYKQGQNWAKEI